MCEKSKKVPEKIGFLNFGGLYLRAQRELEFFPGHFSYLHCPYFALRVVLTARIALEKS